MKTTMESILNNEFDLKYTEIKKYNKELEEDKEMILNIIKNIRKEYLYDSKIHGFNHSVKVMLFAYLIAKSEKLDKIDTRIIIDAALYHDIGRSSDNEDAVHGLSSAYLIDEIDIINHKIYKDNPDNLKILKAIIDGHSTPDKKLELTALNYEVEDFERYKKLYHILKDADALDRKRFREGYNFSLNPDFLRTKKSKELIKLSEEINEIYKKEFENIVPEIKDDGIEKDCIHSIGFDFFKLSTVLKYGILSKSKLKELNIDIPRNFEGGNLDNWISVVDGSLIKENYSGMKEFISNGISFYCVTNYLEKGLEKGLQNQALESGLPYNKGLHKDEKYVYKEIPNSNILSIIIPENYKNTDINELNYIYNSLSIDLFKSKVDYYYNKVKNVPNIDFNKVKPALIEYENYLNDYHNSYGYEKEQIERELPNILEVPRKKVNAVIQEWIKAYYACKLNKNINEKISVSDTVINELNACDLDYSLINMENELLIFINNNIKNKDEQEKTYQNIFSTRY